MSLDSHVRKLAPCSTTPDLEIAIRYAKDWDETTGEKERALIFRVIPEDFMSQGASLSFLSAFPREQEALYPPLTFFKPKGAPLHFVYQGTEFTIVNVRPSFPS